LPENIHTSNILQTNQVTFRNIYVYAPTCIHVTTISEKNATDLKEGKMHIGEVGGRREKEEVI
jgi:chorismate-pyruvate lyase